MGFIPSTCYLQPTADPQPEPPELLVVAHTALARKYRPRQFSEVTTQEHVSDTLRRAVAGNRVGHAYLFCGPRGVGKTTLARVLAMALNCPRRGDDGEPCGTCENCTRIWSGHTSLDVVEIDAASNRGVEDARQLRERAMYAPSAEDRYKVYIVDEAHMLTREAWNALLKVLEEPPPRVIFVFATTEPQKIEQSAAPILSRCQRFDFRRIGTSDIVARLEAVLSEEGGQGDPAALLTLARRAKGGMRDALSSLDQVLSLSGGEVSLDAARRVLGLVEEERYLELFNILKDRRHGSLFAFVDSLVDDGHDLVEFYHGFAEALRLLLRIALDPEGDQSPGARADEFEVPEGWRDLAVEFDAADLLRMLHMAADLESSGSLRRTGSPRMLIEMLLLRCSHLERTIRLEDLLLGGAPAAEGDRGPDRGDGGRAGSTIPERASPARETAGPRGGPRQNTPLSAAEVPLEPLEAWGAILTAGDGLPPGVRPFLEVAEASLDGPSTLVLDLPEGPAYERMVGAGVRSALQAELSRRVGRPLTLHVRRLERGPGEADRISPDTVKQGVLADLFKREPALREAVEVLDLELLD